MADAEHPTRDIVEARTESDAVAASLLVEESYHSRRFQ